MTPRIPLEALFSRREVGNWNDIAVCFGDTFYDLDGTPFERGRAIDTRQGSRLPALLDNKRTVVGDLIPDTSWGASLANILTHTSWNKLREPLIAKNHHVCELCGNRHVRLDVHEIWSYRFPPADEMAFQSSEVAVFGTQTLQGLMTVCTECHECFHLGRANTVGRLGEALERLRMLNHWGTEEMDRYYKEVGRRWEEASAIYWMLDFSQLKHPDGGLTIAGPWYCDEDAPAFLRAPSKFGGDSLTAILNIRWKLARESNWRFQTEPASVGY